ncbi:MAG: FtsX-like permease family protein [Planctomycetota bacterium]
MYRWFLSWRYLVTRPTNLIGVGGITVGVGALIMILSIMTGFLEETRVLLRAGLSDMVIKPRSFEQGFSAVRVPSEPHRLLEVLEQDERIAAATPRLVWFGLVAGVGFDANQTGAQLSDSETQGLNGVQLVGVDVRWAEGHALVGWSLAARLLGFAVEPPRFQDEFDVTALRQELARDPDERIGGYPVRDPYRPFLPPPGLRDVGRARSSIIVGEDLAWSLRLRPGSGLKLATFTIDPRTGDLFQSSRDFVVAGTFRSGENSLDIGRVYMDRFELWDFLGRGATYSEVLVRLDDYERHGERVQADLVRTLQEQNLVVPVLGQSKTASNQVRTWEDFRSAMLGAVENERVLMGIMLSLVMLVAGFTIFAILTMMVGEKRRDIGILASIGASRRGILLTFLTVGFWNALLGTGLGAVAGILLATYINDIEIWLSNQFNVVIFDRTVYAFDTIPAVVQPNAVAIIVGGAFFGTLLFAAIPAWRAARLDPVVALRYE